MKTIFDIIESGNFAQKKINSQLGLSNSISQILTLRQHWKNQFSALNMHEALLKSIGHQYTFYAKNSGIDAIAKSISMRPKFNIPTTAFDAINSISRQHEKLFGNFRNIANTPRKHDYTYTQINNLRFALNGISGQIAAIAAAHKQWNLLDDYENISEQVTEITNNIDSEFALTDEESDRFKNLIEIILAFFKHNKKFGNKALLFLTVIVSLMNVHQYYYFVKDKTKPATLEDLAKFEKKIIQEISTKLKEEKEYRTTNRACRVMLKPKTKTTLLEILLKGYDVTVLQAHHKWVYISFIDSIDNLPQTGWVMKKYLNQPK